MFFKPASATAIRVANAPCSWGVLEFDLAGGAQGCASVLDEMAEAGYAGTELGDWGFMPTDPAQLQQELAARNLAMLAAFVPVALSDVEAQDEGIAVAVQTARLLAAVAERPFVVLADNNGSVPERVVNAGRVRPEHGLSASAWRTFTSGAERLARAVLDETGVRTVFHHHCAGYVETPAEIDRFLGATDPGLIGLCFDTGHYAFGGGDPHEAFSRLADRVWHVHFKDCQPRIASQSREQNWDYFESVRRGVFCELGQGSVNFRGVLDQLIDRGYNGWIVVEQDVLPGMGSPLESARRNRHFLTGLGL